MKRLLGIIALIGLGTGLIACSHTGSLVQAKSKLTTTPTAVETLGEGPTLTPALIDTPILPTQTITPQPTVVPVMTNNIKYELKIDLDYAAMSANVTEVVEYRNQSEKPLYQLIFIVEPNRYVNGFELIKAAVVDSQIKLTYAIEGNQLTLALDPALPAGESIQLSFAYSLNLPEIPLPSDQYKPQPYGYTDKQVNIVDWYLILPPLDSTGKWIVHKPSYFGEYLVFPYADFKVELNLINRPSHVLVASSAKNLSTGGEQYIYELKNARSFSLSLSSYYEVSETTVNGITILSYYFGAEQAAGQEALRATASALELYSSLFEPYSHDTLTVVEADFLDGMEYDGMYFLSKGFYNLYDGTPKGYLTIIAVHETAHQWWYGLVGNDQALEPWLDEGFCTFSELLYYENNYPDLVDWWWYYRVNFYEPVGMINLPVYDYTGFTPYRNAVYLRGAEFLNDLRSELGNDTFFKDLRKYVSDYTGKIATTQDFLSEFGLDSGSQQELLSRYFK